MSKLKVEPLKETYGQRFLDEVESIRDRINFGRIKDQQDRRDYLYPDRVESKVIRTIDIRSDSDLQPRITQPVSADMPNRVSRADKVGPTVDQGFYPHCVTYSGHYVKNEHERREHRRNYLTYSDEWYFRCKEIDPWGPGVDGTGIRYAARIARNRGAYMDDPRSKSDEPQGRLFTIDSYVRLTSIEYILDALFRHGVVWFGIEVDKGIFTPFKTDQGWVVGPPTGVGVGGHAMAATGYWLSMGWIEVIQTWGASYADNGKFYLPITHFQTYSDWDAWTVVDTKALLG